VLLEPKADLVVRSLFGALYLYIVEKNRFYRTAIANLFLSSKQNADVRKIENRKVILVIASEGRAWHTGTVLVLRMAAKA
jgi:hypothetical protein